MKLVRGAWEGLGVLAARMVFASVVADLKKKNKQTNRTCWLILICKIYNLKEHEFRKHSL